MSIASEFTFSQNDGEIVGRTWDVCRTHITMIDDDCDYYATYSFKSDGTYTESRQNNKGNTATNSRGTWSLKNNQLTMTGTPEKGTNSNPKLEEIIWINRDTFYTIRKDGLFGPKVYTFYTAKF